MKVEKLRDLLADRFREQGEPFPFTKAVYVIQTEGMGRAERLLHETVDVDDEERAA